MHRSIFSLVLMLLLLVGVARVHAQDFPPFATSPVSTFTFSEGVVESIVDDASVYKGGFHMNGRVSLAGINPSTFDETTQFSVTVQNSSFDEVTFETTLAGGLFIDSVGPLVVAPGSNVAATIATKNLTFPINAVDLDPDTLEPVKVGTLKITWTATEMKFDIDIFDDSEDYSILGQSLADFPGESDVDDTATVDFVFADHELFGRTIFISGSTTTATVDDVDIARVNISGTIDSIDPVLAILTPASSSTVVRDALFYVEGTARDAHEIDQVLVTLNNGDPVAADFTPADAPGANGTWRLGILPQVGTNVLSVEAFDLGANSQVTTRSFKYLPFVGVTISASGRGSGTVTGDGVSPSIAYRADVPETGGSYTRTAQQVQTDTLTVTATADLGSTFDGWFSGGTLISKLRSLRFSVTPGLTLTAIFNPTLKGFKEGSYTGLIRASDPQSRGFFSLKLDAALGFSGSVRISTLTLPIKGGFDSLGLFGPTKFTVKGKEFTVALEIKVLGNGAKQIVGTVSGNGLDATITADLARFVKAIHEAPQAGVYNVLLPGLPEESGPNFPLGSGFGRVTVNAAGLAKFVGKLGDGTSVSSGTILSESGVWPFFASLYAKRGSISGPVAFDLADPDHDLTGAVDWYRPAPLGFKPPKGVHGEGFSGKSQLVGAKFVKPLASLRFFLNPTSGQGTLSLDAPAASLPKGATLPALTTNPDPTVTIDTIERGSALMVADSAAQALGVKFKIAPSTGLFSGSFIDSTQGNKVVKFGGAVVGGAEPGTSPKVNTAGGFFIRGNRTGFVQIAVP